MKSTIQHNDGLPIETLGESVARMQDSQPVAPARRQRSTLEPGSGRGPRIFSLLLLVAALGLATWETGTNLLQHFTAPTDDDWARAAEQLRSERKPGEPVLFAPHWVDRLGQSHVGPSLKLKLLGLSDVDRFPRVWQMSVRGARHPWIAGLTPVKTWTSGPVKVELFEKEPDKVLFDFTRSMLRSAQVERHGPGSLVRCKRSGKRHSCDPSRSWNWVGPHLAEVGHRPYHSIFVHAVDHQVMRVRYPSVRLGRTLVGYTGIDDFENRKRSTVGVRLKVVVGGKILKAVDHKNEWTWRRFSVDTGRYAGQTHEVSFEVTVIPKKPGSTVKHRGAFARTFCFSAQARK